VLCLNANIGAINYITYFAYRYLGLANQTSLSIGIIRVYLLWKLCLHITMVVQSRPIEKSLVLSVLQWCPVVFLPWVSKYINLNYVTSVHRLLQPCQYEGQSIIAVWPLDDLFSSRQVKCSVLNSMLIQFYFNCV